MLQTIYRGSQGYWRIIPVSGGNPQWGSAGAWSAPIASSTLPGSGTVQARSDLIIGNGANLAQALWRGDQGFTRTVPISGGVPQWGCVNGSPTATPIPPTATPIPTEGSGYPTGKCTCTSDYGACGNILGYTNIKYRSCTANPNGATTCTIVAGGYYDYVSCSDIPTATPVPGCLKKIKGDADCDDNLTLRDYFYYVAKKAGAVLPPTVNVDFNASGTVDDADRTIIVNSLLGR